MKTLSHLYLVVAFLCVISCKKSADSPPSQIERSISYKVVATIPSPADIQRGVYEDSLSLKGIASNSTLDPNFLQNFPGVGANLSPLGFSIGYNNANLPLAHFLLTSNAFASVPGNIELNKIYETVIPETNMVPIFLGKSNGIDAWNYFVDNEYPNDADGMRNSSRTSVKFTRVQEFQTQAMTDPILVVDGEASGYVIYTYSSADPSKYMHRLDFTLKFTGLVLNL